MKKRIFIAVKIKPNDVFTDIISSLKAGLSNENIRWTRKGNIHITLAFLGDTDEEKITTISMMLKKICGGSGKFELNIKGLGIFKNLSNPRVIWSGIESPEEFPWLHNQIMTGLRNSGFIIEERPFKPHLTIGRIKYIKDKTLLNTLIERYQNKEIQRIEINEVILYESIILPSGPVYKPLITVEL